MGGIIMENSLLYDDVVVREKRLSRNSNYFETIDSRDKAYWLGIMYSDGCVCKRKEGKYSISLEMVDQEHIEKFKNALNSAHKICTIRHKGYENAKLSYSIHIYDNKIANDLINLGCVPRKSACLSSIPDIPKEFVYDFIRGFVDGDGCISYKATKDSYSFMLVGASQVFLKNVMKFLDIDKLSLIQTTKTSYLVSCSNRDDIYRILTKLYEHSTYETRLDRKFNKYQEFIEWYNKKKNR
jgi:DNA-binding transcriptional regulator WhiA